jgi:hypothetical protein
VGRGRRWKGREVGGKPEGEARGRPEWGRKEAGRRPEGDWRGLERLEGGPREAEGRPEGGWRESRGEGRLEGGRGRRRKATYRNPNKYQNNSRNNHQRQPISCCHARA